MKSIWEPRIPSPTSQRHFHSGTDYETHVCRIATGAIPLCYKIFIESRHVLPRSSASVVDFEITFTTTNILPILVQSSG